MVKLYREKHIDAFMLILFFQQLKGGMSQGQNHLKDCSLGFHKLLRIIQGAFHNTTL